MVVAAVARWEPPRRLRAPAPLRRGRRAAAGRGRRGRSEPATGPFVCGMMPSCLLRLSREALYYQEERRAILSLESRIAQRGIALASPRALGGALGRTCGRRRSRGHGRSARPRSRPRPRNPSAPPGESNVLAVFLTPPPRRRASAPDHTNTWPLAAIAAGSAPLLGAITTIASVHEIRAPSRRREQRPLAGGRAAHLGCAAARVDALRVVRVKLRPPGFRHRGTGYLSEAGMTWVSASTKRRCNRALGAP